MGSQSHRHTPSPRGHHNRGPPISSIPAPAGGARVPATPVSVHGFLKRKSGQVWQKAGGRGRRRRTRHPAAGGSGGRAGAPPPSLQGPPEAKRPERLRTRRNGGQVSAKRADLAAGKAAPGVLPRLSNPCARNPSKRSEKQQQERGRLRHPPASPPLGPSGGWAAKRRQRRRGLAKAPGLGMDRGMDTRTSAQRKAEREATALLKKAGFASNGKSTKQRKKKRGR